MKGGKLNNKLIKGFILLFLLAAIVLFLKLNTPNQAAISSFDECAAAGNPIMESYPERCRTPDGREFVRSLSNEEKSNLEKDVVIDGKITCLPHWDTSGPHTLECALGLLSNSGEYYVLRDPQNSAHLGYWSEAEVSVIGILTPGSDEKYQSVGIIDVSLVYPIVE